MEKKDLVNLEGKKIKVVLNNNFFYECKILSIGTDYIKIRDKYDKIVFITIQEIKLLEVIQWDSGNVTNVKKKDYMIGKEMKH